MKVLFVCNLNKHRSRTAEELFKNNKKHSFKSAGIFDDAINPLTKELIIWANIIFVFESEQADFISLKFPEASGKKIVNLDIVDMYDYGTDSLIEQLKIKLKKFNL